MPYEFIAILQKKSIFDEKSFSVEEGPDYYNAFHVIFVILLSFLLIRSDHGAGRVVWIWQIPQCWDCGET